MMKRLTVLLGVLACGAVGCSDPEPSTSPSSPDAGTSDLADMILVDAGPDLGAPEDQPVDMPPVEDMTTPDADMSEPVDQGQDQSDDMDAEEDMAPSESTGPIRGRFESAGPIRNCNDLATWNAPDGFLLRPQMGVCDDDMTALADTIVANLDAAAARDARVMLVIGQGLNLPSSWLDSCETYSLQFGRFTGESCVPWDSNYQAKLQEALQTHIGPRVKDHQALAGVYFTISTMTNGSEMHFRTNRSTFSNYPGDEVLRQSYKDVMAIYQDAFDVPIVFEAGHCLWNDDEDCQTPFELYTSTRDTYGVDAVGVAMWNCAERFFVSENSPEFHTRPIFEEASKDGASIGCQTVGSFAQACRFTSTETANYGTPPMGPGNSTCPDSTPEDIENACVDTVDWFRGARQINPASPVIQGTWGEFWSADMRTDGVYHPSTACQEAIDAMIPDTP